MNIFSVFQHLQKDKQRKQRHSLKLGKKRRESSKRNYYIISPRVIIKAIIIISRTSLFPIPVAFIQHHSLRLVLTSRPLCACGYVCNSGVEAIGKTRRSMQILAAEQR